MAGFAPANPAGTEPAKLPPVVILSDDPTPIDELGDAHRRVATAIAALIYQGADSGRSIALTGSWGSGKSSVIEMLRKQLAQQTTPNYRPSLFLFDAWAHQGDPLRRAFLERLIEHAALLDSRVKNDKIPWPGKKPDARQMTRQEGWLEELDLVTGRREKSEAHADRPLTAWGLAVAISLLFCLPLGGVFLSKYDTSKFFWTSNFVWLAIVAYATPVLVALVAWWKDGRKADTFKSLLLREATQDTTTTTVKTREPSSVDFQKVFARIAEYLLENERRRLVIAIDNLDRIDAGSAVSMWATMRIFFEIDDAPWKKRIWLIVPFDRTALSGLWQSADGNPGNDFVDSFLNKTFQIVFHVSPAVLTTWKKYFSEQLEKAFRGQEQENDRNAVFELFALKKTSPSPRDIKIFVNKISALRLQWAAAPEKDRIELPFLAAYVLYQNEIGVDGAGLLTGNVLTQEAVNILARYKPGADCGGKLAAAHFNVPPDQATQVLLGNRFSDALAAGNNETLRELRQSANFWTVFERFSRTQLAAWQQPTTLVRVVKFLERSETEDEKSVASISSIWPTALSAAGNVPDWGHEINQDQAEAFSLILNRSAATPQSFQIIARGILSYLTNQANRLNASNSTKADMSLWVIAARNIISEIQKHPEFVAISQGFRPTAVPTLFISLTAAALVLEGALLVLEHLTCSSSEDVPATLVASLSTMGEEEFLSLKTALVAKIPADWGKFDAAAASTLPTLTAGNAVTAIRAVLQPRAGRANVDELLKQMSPTALKKLTDSGFDEKAHWKEAGVFAVACLLGGSDEANSFQTRFGTEPAGDLTNAMTDALSEFGLSSKVLASDFPSPIGTSLLGVILSKGRFDDLDPEIVITHYSSLAPEMAQKIVQSAATSANFLQHFTERRFVTLESDQFPFYTAWLPALDPLARERVALVLAPMLAQLPIAVNISTVSMVNVLADTSGAAWLSMAQASQLLPELDQQLVSSPGGPDKPALEEFKKHLENRIALGDSTVQQLLDSAETAPPPDRDHLRELAIDRGRADWATAKEDNHNEALLAWGQALLARSRRGPWLVAKPFAERAQQVFEMASRL